MAFLAPYESVEHVVGVDGIRSALEEFVKEQPALEIQPMANSGWDSFERFQGKKITLLKGDYFELDETSAGGRFGAMLDRGSLVAIEPTMREKYIHVMGKLIAPGGKILLICLERQGTNEEAVKKGPPFSIPEALVRSLFESQEWVDTCSKTKIGTSVSSSSTLLITYRGGSIQ